MGRKKPDADQVMRRRVVRAAIATGMSIADLVRQMTVGFEVRPGVFTSVSEATARRDIEAVEEEFAGLFSNEQAADVEIAVCYELYKAISKKAMEGGKPQFHAAITAVDRRVRIAASASSRWRHLAGNFAPRASEEDDDNDLDPEVVARLVELNNAPDDQIVKRHRVLMERMERLGLSLVPGTKAAG